MIAAADPWVVSFSIRLPNLVRIFLHNGKWQRERARPKSLLMYDVPMSLMSLHVIR